jgi:hypothetical protein
MSDALNAKYFRNAPAEPFNPRWLNAARGANPLATGWPEYNGGIEMPKQVHMRIGQKYFRFASSKNDKESSQFGGPWWVEFESLKEITNYSRRFSSPRDSVRYMLSIPWEWSEVDKLVYAILEKPLDAYRGKGKPAQPRGMGQVKAHPNDRGVPYTPPQHLNIMQLYIPGLYDPDTKSTEIRRKVFPQVQIEDMWKSKYFR